MNKKGAIINFTTLLILFGLTLGLIFTIADQEGIDTTNITQNLSESIRENLDLNLSIQTPEAPEIGNAISYSANGIAKAYAEVAVWVINFVEANPQAPYKLLLYGFILSILAPLIIVLFKLLVIIFLLTKEVIQSKKEKREIKRYEKKV